MLLEDIVSVNYMYIYYASIGNILYQYELGFTYRFFSLKKNTEIMQICMKFSLDSIHQSLRFTFQKLFHVNVGHNYLLGSPFVRSSFGTFMSTIKWSKRSKYIFHRAQIVVLKFNNLKMLSRCKYFYGNMIKPNSLDLT